MLVFSVVGLFDAVGTNPTQTRTNVESNPVRANPAAASNGVVSSEVSSSTSRSSEGEVSVELMPKGYRDGKFTMGMAVNTHTISDLNKYDLKAITTLTVAGKTYNPISVPELGGHHNSGELIFELPVEPQEYQITISGLDAVPTRTFTWP